MTQGTPLTHTPAPTPAEMDMIARIAHQDAGLVIAPAKASMVQSRLSKRLRVLGLAGYAEYLGLVQSEAGREERQQMISALTTNVTHFFREAHHFTLLRDHVLPDLVLKARGGARVRLWSAGCAAGQEAWSIAMTLLDLMPDAPGFDIRILATDIDPAVLDRARTGIYAPEMTDGISPALQRRFLMPTTGGVGICDAARALVSFRQLNLHSLWPMQGKFDAIFCRNVVIYFDLAAQTRLWQRFADVLAPGGWLFVGHSERVPISDGSQFETAGITTYRLRPGAGTD